MKDDTELLKLYTEERSESAFTELIHRHIDVVYHTALRRTDGDPHRAADVTQSVFTTLAQKAPQLRIQVLGAWLHTATRNAALNLMISERRRQVREREAAALVPADSFAPVAWELLRPVIDDAIDDLPEADRAAVVLRFLERKSFAAVGAALRVSADAARMRTERALEKLRSELSRRGITSTAAALATAVAAQPAVAAPPGMASSLAVNALAAAGFVGAMTLGVQIEGVLSSLTTKLAAIGVVAIATTAAFFYATVWAPATEAPLKNRPLPSAIGVPSPAPRLSTPAPAVLARVPDDPPAAASSGQGPAALAALLASSGPRQIKIVASNPSNEMKFDRTELAAIAGEEVQLTLTNAGTTPKIAMGHNWVLLKSGVDIDDFTLEAAGAAASGYIPDRFRSRIVAYTKVLGPGESDTISFKAPESTGEYTFICSFPGHATTMKGTLKVLGMMAPAGTGDPSAGIGKNFVKDWTVDELFRVTNLALNAGGRNFERGQKVFDVAGCALCHHFGGGVGGIGPDLTGVGGKFGAREILESVIEPSAVISDLYGKVIVTTTDGHRYEGRPAGQTADTYSLIAAPSIDPDTGTMSWIGPVRNIPLNTIENIEDSPTSPMPTGLLMNFTQDEIYDFIAFLISAGNPDDKMFKPAK